jgi:hypothetical protein
VHKLRKLDRKAPKHALAELREDFHRIVYAASGESARAAYTAYARKWSTRCPGVARSLAEGGDELLTFFRFPKAQWKTLRTTNAIERLNEEFRRRVKTQGSLPTEDAAVSLLFGLVASGQIRLRKIDGHTKLATVIRARMTPAADGMSCYGEVRRGGDRKRDRQEALQSTIVIEAIPRYPPQRVLRAAVVLRGGPGRASLNFHTKRDTTPWGRSSV